jgi:hypothetical protein
MIAGAVVGFALSGVSVYHWGRACWNGMDSRRRVLDGHDRGPHAGCAAAAPRLRGWLLDGQRRSPTNRANNEIAAL